MFSISPDQLKRLEEAAHELSNSVGMAAAYLELGQKTTSIPLSERFATALRLTSECRMALISLMWQLGQIRISGGEEGHGNQSI